MLSFNSAPLINSILLTSLPCDITLIYHLNLSEQLSGLRNAELYELSALRVVEKPSNTSQKILKLTIKPNYNIHNGNRTELPINDFLYENQLSFYILDLLVPKSFISETGWQILAQWHDQPDSSPLWQDSCHYLKFNQLGR